MAVGGMGSSYRQQQMFGDGEMRLLREGIHFLWKCETGCVKFEAATRKITMWRTTDEQVDVSVSIQFQEKCITTNSQCGNPDRLSRMCNASAAKWNEEDAGGGEGGGGGPEDGGQLVS